MTTPETIATRLPWDAANPYEYYENHRRAGDVVWDETAGTWLVLGYHAARQVLGGADWTSDPLANTEVRGALSSFDTTMFSGNMLFTDGAEHTRLRGSVRDVFTPGFIDGLREGVESITADVIDNLSTGTPFDFMNEIALPLPIAVASAWLGLDVEASQVLREESPAIIRTLGAFADADTFTAGAAAGAVLTTEILPLAADRRANPSDDLLSFIADDRNLELDEVVATAILIAVAGHETTANLLGAAMIRLLTPLPDGTRLADNVDPTDPRLITELLRLDGPVQAAGRTATADQQLGDIKIERGQTVLVVVAAANRDPQVFENPTEFRLDRQAPPPVAFGYGAHHCLGSALARLETTIALQAILNRDPALAGAASWRDTPAIRGPLGLPMTFGI